MARARGMQALEALVPADGTSLYNAFAAARGLSPQPDQIVLITDGLPTQGKTRGLRRYVNSAERMRLFDEAVSQLPEHVPIDSVLLQRRCRGWCRRPGRAPRAPAWPARGACRRSRRSSRPTAPASTTPLRPRGD